MTGSLDDVEGIIIPDPDRHSIILTVYWDGNSEVMTGLPAQFVVSILRDYADTLEAETRDTEVWDKAPTVSGAAQILAHHWVEENDTTGCQHCEEASEYVDVLLDKARDIYRDITGKALPITHPAHPFNVEIARKARLIGGEQ